MGVTGFKLFQTEPSSYHHHQSGMGVKTLHCFPWQRRCRERGTRHRPLQAVLPGDTPVYLSPTAVWCSPGEGRAGDTATHRVYLPHKACVALRHQMDCNVIDETS
ncbi:uncharacterized protein si:ch211-237l4.6 [Anguilla anguilla]|uniref:uncharacterized protein si:ch211-237l4.6 n=1 Tax=Anguilla anguilla TaxID=7936 RepID=UPI0015B37960|nr:uncharacterized protein si:ch211-237l4.6 [Anguilla anguilla]